MAVVSETAELPAPPEKVWEKVGDLSTYPEWLTLHQGFPDGTPELAEGVEFKEKVKIMGMPGEVAWTVKTCEPNKRLELEGKGPMGTTTRAGWALEANGGDSTNLTYEGEFAGAALAPMAGALEKESRKTAVESIEKLRQLLS